MWIRALTVSVAVLSLSVALAGSQIMDSPGHGGHTSKAAGQAAGAFNELMSVAMDKMHAEMAGTPQSGDIDRDFLAMMIPHHAGAVEMARLVLVYGKDPLVRQLAEEIIAGQQAEIRGMEARLKILEKGPDPRPDGFPALTGTRGE